MQKAAFFDIDGTLTVERVWMGIMLYFKEHHIRRWTHRAYIGFHYPLYILKKLGLISETNFRRDWAAHLAWYFRGYSKYDIDVVWDWVMREHVVHIWREETVVRLRQHLEQGDEVVLVSSGPTTLSELIAHELGAQHAVGTDFEMRDGVCTGRSMQPVCIGRYKASMAQVLLQEKGVDVDLRASFAYADSTSDLQMLEMVGHPIAVYPSDDLRKIAVQRGWQILI